MNELQAIVDERALMRELQATLTPEIKAEFAKRGGGLLRDRNAPIHDSCMVDDTTVFLPLPSRVHSEKEAQTVCR